MVEKIDQNFFVSSLGSLGKQLLGLRAFLLIALIVITAAFICPYLISVVLGVPASQLTRDSLAITGAEAYVGAMSMFGIILWSASFGICFFGAAMTSGDNQKEDFRRFIRSSGIITIVLVMDDAFLLHEHIFPTYFGIPEKIIYLAYITAIGIYILRYAKQILQAEYSILIVALVFFGASIIMDVILPLDDLYTFIEDGMKFYGIAFWLMYFSRTTYKELRKD